MADDPASVCGNCGSPVDAKLVRCAQCGAANRSGAAADMNTAALLLRGCVLLGLGGYCAIAWAGAPRPDPGWAGIEWLPCWMMLGGAAMIYWALDACRRRRAASTGGTPRRRF